MKRLKLELVVVGADELGDQKFSPKPATMT